MQTEREHGMPNILRLVIDTWKITDPEGSQRWGKVTEEGPGIRKLLSFLVSTRSHRTRAVLKKFQ